jgi:F420-non-reducing hydrogenase small subunit
LPTPKLAIFTATGCRGCEHTILDVHYQFHPLHRIAHVVFWPYVLGSQLNSLKTIDMLDVCLFAGAIRTETDRQAALELRRKSRIVVELGACSAFGGMPGLVNLSEKTGRQARVSVQASEAVFPPVLEELESRVLSLDQVIAVDYIIPGCPPTHSLTWAALQAVLGTGASRTHLSFAMSRLPKTVAQSIASEVLPPKGSVFAGEKAVCASCSRQKEEKRFAAVIRPYQAYESTGRCLLEQGMVCQGIATREGCGGLCTGVGVPCRGCFGKTKAVLDAGAKMVSAISSTFDSEKPSQIENIAKQFHDLAGTFYRYTLPSQCLLFQRGHDADHNP